MRAALVLLFVSPLGLLAATAHADALPPDPDPYMACEDQALGSACFSELGDGICVEMDCPSNPGQKCGYCDPNATATTSAGTTDGGAVGATDASSSGSDGGTSDGTTPKKEEGCGCRSDASPGAALGLLGLVGLLRRRRR
jgi:MYXO-CTERM domain-containing protein